MTGSRIGLAVAAFAGLLLAACSTPPPATPDLVAVRVSPKLTPSGKIEALRVEMRFTSDADGRALIRLPNRFANSDDLLKGFTDLTATGGVLTKAEQPGAWTLDAPPSSPVVVSYLVHSSIDHPPTARDEQPYGPWIFDDWFYAFGQSIFARLDRPASTPATFEWTGGSAFVFASDIDASSRAAIDLGAIGGAKMIAGRDVRILNDGAIRFAVRGHYDLPENQLFKTAVDIVRLERRFWGKPVDSPYLVTLGPVDADSGVGSGIGGTGGGHAFALSMSPGIPLSRYLLTLAHEMFHTFPLGDVGRDEVWLNEGFADYYSKALLFRADLLSMDEFAESWNEVLLEYAGSSVRTWTNARLTPVRFTDPDAGRMPYIRGALLAVMWDQRLREASGGAASLDDTLHEVPRRAATGAKESAGALLALIAAEAGVDIADDIAAHIARGDPILLPADAFGSCFEVESLTIPTFDRGFDAEATVKAGMVASGVRPGGPAYRAGLRDGMRLARQAGGRFGDSMQDYVWVVQTPGQPEQTLRWKPAGSGSIAIQRLRRTDVGGDAKSCGLG